jgi:hypothetical protein
MGSARTKVVAILGGLALAALGFAYWGYRQTLGYSPPPVEPLSPAQVQEAQAEIRDVKQEIEEASRAIKQGRQPELRLEVHEEAVNTLLNQDLAQKLARVGISQPRVQILDGGVVEAGAWVQRDGRRIWVSGKLQLGPGVGKPTVEPLELRLGNMPMPESMERRLMDRYKQRLESVDLGLNGRQVEVESSPGVLRIVTVP